MDDEGDGDMSDKQITLGEVRKIVKDAIETSGTIGEAEVIISWTAEEWLGEMKRRKEIQHFAQDKNYEDGNLRRYLIEY